MKMVLAIAAGGAAGALLRYWGSLGAHALLGRNFPYGTLLVNVIGSLLIGLLSVLLVERIAASQEMRAMLLIGVLGAFTTFSSFSLETWRLFEDGLVFKAGMNIGLNLVLCLVATWLGLLIGRQL